MLKDSSYKYLLFYFSVYNHMSGCISATFRSVKLRVLSIIFIFQMFKYN